VKDLHKGGDSEGPADPRSWFRQLFFSHQFLEFIGGRFFFPINETPRVPPKSAGPSELV
jgi:hypothetical protein